MRASRLLVAVPSAALLVVGIGGASAYAGVVVAAKRVPTLAAVCVSRSATHAVTAAQRGQCPAGTTYNRLPSSVRGAQGVPGVPGLPGVTGATGAAGAAGVAGAAGPKGDKGDKGAAGATSVKVVSVTQSVGANTDYTFVAACAAGSRATGGGFSGNPAATVKVVSSMPRFGANNVPFAWDVRVFNSGATKVNATAFVVCAAP